jgi:hypothetical protein
MQIVKIIHVIQRLEALDRDLYELREMKRKLSNDRAYFDEMVIAFDKQINLLVSERVKLMELKIENPPEYLLTKEWRIKEISEKVEDNRELQSPDAEGPILNQSQVDSVVSRVKDQIRKRKQPTIYIGRKSSLKNEASDTENRRGVSVTSSGKTEQSKGKNYQESKQKRKDKETEDDLGAFKY